MLDDQELQHELEEVVQRGEANAAVIRLAQNWCRLLEVHRSKFFGVGIPEQMTGLPISPREFRCRHAKPTATGYGRTEDAALAFYDDNCANCKYREPVSLPNLSTLVDARDDARQKEQAAKVAADEARRVALQERHARREHVVELLDSTQKGLVELMRALDDEPESDRARRLTEAARAAPQRFSDAMRDLLYDLVAVGGYARLDGALGALDLVETDRARLASIVSSVLARRQGTRHTVQLAGRLVPRMTPDEIAVCLPAMVSLATPSPPPFMAASSAVEPDSGPLLTAFEHQRDAVVRYVAHDLRGGSPWRRRGAAHAAAALLRQDASLVDDLTPDLVRSVLLPDDRDASPRAAAEMAVGICLEASPSTADTILRATLASTEVTGRAVLFGIIERYLRLSDKTSSTQAVEVCVRHLVEALSAPDEVERLGEAGRAIEYVSRDHPDLISVHAEQLLGASALLAERIDAKSDGTKVQSILPPELQVLEESNRRQTQAMAMREIVAALARLGPEQPEQVGALILDTLGNLGEEHDRLRAELVRGLGHMGAQLRGLRMALPGLYVGVMHQSALVRAAAAEAYGAIARYRAEDLPDLMHEAFELLLQDPYVIVHISAAKALEHGAPAGRFRKIFAGLVGQLVVSYRKAKRDDAFLAKTIEVFCHLVPQDEMTPQTAAYLIDATTEIDPNSAWDALRFLGRRFQGHSKYADAILSLLRNPRTHTFYLDDIAARLKEIPAQEISRIAPEIVRAAPDARERAQGQSNPTFHLLASLGGAGEWVHAQTLCAEWLADPELQAWSGAVAGVERMASAARIEAASMAGDAPELRKSLDEWDQLLGRQEPAAPSASVFLPAFRLRVQALRSLQSGAPAEATYEQLSQQIADVAQQVDGAPGERYRAFGELLSALAMLHRWPAAVRAAETDAGRFLRAAKQRAGDARAALGSDPSSVTLAQAASLVEVVQQPPDIEPVLYSLRNCTLPLPLDRRQRAGPPAESPRTRANRPPDRCPVAVVSFSVDGQVLSEGRVIQPNVIHDLGVRVDLSRWVEGARELVLYPASVEPPDVFQLPVFRIRASSPLDTAGLTDTGRLVLRLAQSIRSRPLEFRYSATMIAGDGREVLVDVEGQRGFRVRSYDPNADPATGNPELDRRLIDLADTLRNVGSIRGPDCDDLLLLMTEFGRIAAESIASNTFSTRDWDESRWQDWVRTTLRSQPRIGAELEEHPHVAGGITDLSFHRVRIELKVEQNVLVTLAEARNYAQQTAQYVAGSQKRVGLLAILDVSPKDEAPGSVSNSLDLLYVQDPGGGSFPIAVGVVVVRGNLARPSDLSR